MLRVYGIHIVMGVLLLGVWVSVAVPMKFVMSAVATRERDLVFAGFLWMIEFPPEPGGACARLCWLPECGVS
jgi:hypothetical protein